jgi:hypothetical protein
MNRCGQFGINLKAAFWGAQMRVRDDEPELAALRPTNLPSRPYHASDLSAEARHKIFDNGFFLKYIN